MQRGASKMSQQKRLSLLLTLNVLMIAGLVIVGLTAHSLGVLAAGCDYVADSTAILLGIIAIAIRNRNGEHSRATTIVALINGLALLVVTVLVIAEAFRRLLAGTPVVNGLSVLIVSVIATIVMVGGALILGREAGSEDLHMRSVLLDTVSDALTAAAVAVTGAIFYFAHGLYWLDPVIAIVIGVIVGFGALRLLRDVMHALRSHTALELDDD
ncbi:MAG: cation diffusion facilitator family transporter, partial [Thermomicrobiales bacterium]